MSNRQKRGCLLVMLGLCLVLTAMGMHLAQEQQDSAAGESAQILLEHLDLSRSVIQIPSESVEPVADTPAMTVKTYMGYDMIGAVRIPSVEVNLPVLADWSYALLDVAPCRYRGSVTGGDLILMGHNYKSHFTPLHRVSVGADVEFEDVNGQVYAYRVAEIQYLHKSEEDKLASAYPLTLFTCTAGGQKRIVLFCEAAE